MIVCVLSILGRIYSLISSSLSFSFDEIFLFLSKSNLEKIALTFSLLDSLGVCSNEIFFKEEIVESTTLPINMKNLFKILSPV